MVRVLYVLVAAWLAFCGCSASVARAQSARTLTYDARIEPALTALGGLLWVGGEVLKGELAPDACRWCEDNPFDRGARSALRWSNPARARRTSDAFGFAIVPALALGGLVGAAARDDALHGAWIDVAIVLEAAVLSADVTQIVKLIAGRERPFVHALDGARKTQTSYPADNNLSFFSGHSSLAFSLAVSSAMVASLRGYRLAPVLWTVGPVLAAFTGGLRVAGDKHYLSDVLTGAAVGAAIGALVPWLHARGDQQRSLSPSLSPSHVALTFRH
jgi:membrane-associated phospholipid phosphatase